MYECEPTQTRNIPVGDSNNDIQYIRKSRYCRWRRSTVKNTQWIVEWPLALPRRGLLQRHFSDVETVEQEVEAKSGVCIFNHSFAGWNMGEDMEKRLSFQKLCYGGNVRKPVHIIWKQPAEREPFSRNIEGRY